MADYKVKRLSAKDYKTTEWSGGMTTEFAIAPEGSRYADRDFLWRLSSATVELEESNFTRLSDYHRLIMTLKGAIRLSHNGGEWIKLPEFTVHDFDGGDETVSVGRVIDFNLMLRKDKCSGGVIAFRPKTGETGRLEGLLSEPVESYDTILVYCWEGKLELTLEGGEPILLTKGDTLRLDGSFFGACWKYRVGEGTAAVLAAIRRGDFVNSLNSHPYGA